MTAPSQSKSRIERRRRREEARDVRDDEALRLYASGLSFEEIAIELSRTFGTSPTSVSNTYLMIRRALTRHHVNTEDVDTARVRVITHLEALLHTWMPRALGNALDAQLQPVAPSDKAAGIVLQTLDRYAQLTGAVQSVGQTTNIAVSVTVPADADDKRRLVMDSLRREADKLRIVDVELASAGTSLEHAGGNNPRQEQLPPPEGTAS